MAQKILVVDDEPSLVRLVTKVLADSGYEVSSASDGQEALRAVFAGKPDLVLLDVVMPRMDGWQTCSRIREMSNVPVIMLTGTSTSEEDVARGIDYGADDYILKPVGNKQLVAKVRAVLRRAELPSSLDTKPTTYDDGYLAADLDERKVIVDGERVKLTPTEFRLFAVLAKNPGHVFTHKQLLEEVWGWEYADDVDYVRIYILHLRRKIEPAPGEPRYIMTEPGVGYYFHKPK